MSNSQTQLLNNLLDDAIHGKMSALEEFFGKLWISGAVLPAKEIRPVSDKVYGWMKPMQDEHPSDFAKATLGLAYTSFLEGKYEQALQECIRAQKLFHEMSDEDSVQACNVLIASNYRSVGEIELTLKYDLEAYRQLSKTGAYKVFQAFCTYTLAEIYNETNQLNEALNYYGVVLPIAEELKNEFMIARAYVGIAVAYQRQKKYALALEYFNKGLQLCDQADGAVVRARILTDMGVYYFEMGDYESAISYQQQALAIREELKIVNAPVTNLIHLGEIYRKQGRFDEALDVLQRGLLLAEELKVKMKVFQIHKLLSDIYLSKGDSAKCFFHHKAFHEIKEEVQHEDSERKIKNLHLVFEAEQTMQENVVIKAQKKEIEDKNLQLQETIDELTITKISRKARGVTLAVGIALIVAEEPLMGYAIRFLGEENFLLSLAAKVIILLSLKPIDKAIEKYMLRRFVIKKRKRVAAQRRQQLAAA
jgi:tetratricopeptide (TPR) repeat protein